MAFKLRYADSSPLSKSAGVPVSFQSPLNQKSEIEARRAAAQTAKAAREAADAEKYVSKEVDVKGGRMSNKQIRKASKFVADNATTDSNLDTAIQGGQYKHKTGNVFTRLAGKDSTKRSGTGSYTTVGDLGEGEALSGKERRKLKRDVKSTLKEGGKGVTVKGSKVTKGTTQTKTVKQNKESLAKREASRAKKAGIKAANVSKRASERAEFAAKRKASREAKSGSAANYGTPLLQDTKSGWVETGRTSTTRKGKNEAGVSGTFTDVNITEGRKTPGTKTPRTRKGFSTDPTEKAKQKKWIKDNPEEYEKIKKGKTTPPKNETRSNLNTTFVPDKPKPTPTPKTPPTPTPKKKKREVLDSGGSTKTKRRKGLNLSSGPSKRKNRGSGHPCKSCN